MNLVEETPAAGDPPLTEAVAVMEAPAALMAPVEVTYDLEALMTEALEADKIMTAIRLHGAEVEHPHPKMPEWHLELHQQALDAHLGQLAAYGLSEADVPAAPLQFQGSSEPTLTRLMARPSSPA
ncbi:MAG TPA: hypothetical protein VHA37_09475 [Candidatus Saccharimonadales bacterium]|nr:hypothetical protein [Candidatus Saccharimonadales bacterium]